MAVFAEMSLLGVVSSVSRIQVPGFDGIDMLLMLA